MPDIQTILNKINRSIVDDTDIERVINVLRSGFLSRPDGGPAATEFQKLMAEMLDKIVNLFQIMSAMTFRLTLAYFKSIKQMEVLNEKTGSFIGSSSNGNGNRGLDGRSRGRV
jgi:hypothetical protein